MGGEGQNCYLNYPEITPQENLAAKLDWQVKDPLDGVREYDTTKLVLPFLKCFVTCPHAQGGKVFINQVIVLPIMIFIYWLALGGK